MNPFKKIVSIYKTMRDENLFLAIDAEQLHLYTKCLTFKRSNYFNTNQYGVKNVKIY